MAYWGEGTTQYPDYYIVRFLEDFTEIFNTVRESVPLKFYELTDHLTQFEIDRVKWIDIRQKDDSDDEDSDDEEGDDDDDDFDDEFWDSHEKLTSWLFKRTLFASHLVGGPAIAFVRYNHKIKIHFKANHILENGLKMWTATTGVYEMDYLDFVAAVKDFGDRFFTAMDKQVELAIAKDWKEIKLDKVRLVEEHAERKKGFYTNYTLLTKTYWTEIEGIYDQMVSEIK